MAQYKHLPIYKKTYELLEFVTRETKNFPRDFRYTLGSKIIAEVVDLVIAIYRANSVTENRAANLQAIVERMQVVTLLLRLCKDMRILSVDKFSSAVIVTDSITRQASGWARQSQAARAEL